MIATRPDVVIVPLVNELPKRIRRGSSSAGPSLQSSKVVARIGSTGGTSRSFLTLNARWRSGANSIAVVRSVRHGQNGFGSPLHDAFGQATVRRLGAQRSPMRARGDYSRAWIVAAAHMANVSAWTSIRRPPDCNATKMSPITRRSSTRGIEAAGWREPRDRLRLTSLGEHSSDVV